MGVVLGVVKGDIEVAFDENPASKGMTRNSLTPLIFIFGSPRSGTTLMREILNQHSKVHIVPETGFYDRLWAARCGLGKVTARDSWVRWLYYVLFQSHDPGMMANRDTMPALIQEFTDRPPRGSDDFFIRTVSYLGEIRGKSVFGEKTPKHLLYWRRIFAGFPQARAIVMVRDPRAVAASMITRGDLVDSAWKAAVEWCCFADMAKSLLNRRNLQAKLVPYEELVQNSFTVIKGLCDFLGLDFQDGMVKVDGSNSSYGQPLESGIFTNSLGHWQGVLSQNEIAVIERIAGSRLARCGYKSTAGEHNGKLNKRELTYYLKMRAEIAIGYLGLRPNRAYLRHLQSRVIPWR